MQGKRQGKAVVRSEKVASENYHVSFFDFVGFLQNCLKNLFLDFLCLLVFWIFKGNC